MRNKEEIYDQEISPLVIQILSICRQNGIAVLMDFPIPTEEKDDLRCTSLLPDGEGKNHPAHLKVIHEIRGRERE